jgi:hypothetical protein
MKEMTEVENARPDGYGPASPDMAFLTVQHPEEIVANLVLSTAEKREILASWASDERAVLGSPTLRQLPSGAIVRLYEIQRALLSLDRKDGPPHRRLGTRDTFRSRRGLARWLARKSPRPWDDDDDPPPVPTRLHLPAVLSSVA